MKHNKKTNAARILDEAHISYEIMEYQVDEEHLDAIHVAAEVGMPAEQVFKTLCVRGDKTGVIFAVIPGVSTSIPIEPEFIVTLRFPALVNAFFVFVTLAVRSEILSISV